jgi:hypothetical protein
MAGRVSLGQISESEYSNLLQALFATTKGRSFLAEYSRRGRPQDTLALLETLHRIEATIATVRDQLQPERIAEELKRIGMTMEIAIDGAPTDPDGDETARRFSLVARARRELASLAQGLGGEIAPTPEDPSMDGQAIELVDDEAAFMRQLGVDFSPDR